MEGYTSFCVALFPRQCGVQEVERSDGSRQKLLNPLTKEGSSALPKFSSISLGQQKFTPEDLIVETIANSEKAWPHTPAIFRLSFGVRVILGKTHTIQVAQSEINGTLTGGRTANGALYRNNMLKGQMVTGAHCSARGLGQPSVT